MLSTYNENYTRDWVMGVADSGTFEGNPNTPWKICRHGIPKGWEHNVTNAVIVEGQDNLYMYIDDYPDEDWDQSHEGYHCRDHSFLDDTLSDPEYYGANRYEYTG